MKENVIKASSEDDGDQKKSLRHRRKGHNGTPKINSDSKYQDTQSHSSETEMSPLSEDFSATLKVGRHGEVKLLAPGTPWNEVDLSESFLFEDRQLGTSGRHTQGIFARRRWFFIIGGLLGAFLGWLFTDAPTSFSDLEFDLDQTFSNVKEMINTRELSSLLPQMNLSDVFSSSSNKSWLKNHDFTVGRQALSNGLQKKHAVLLIPGIISSGLESWGTTEEHAPFFRNRIWGTAAMLRAVVTRKEAWLKAIKLDLETGLDPPGVKVRAAQGFDAAAYFVQGYWIWQKIIENLAVLDYDPLDMSLLAYDWRLTPLNLEIRDRYFSRMKVAIEHSKQILGKKTVLVSHSMGGSIVLFFLKWVEARGEHFGNGGTDWVENHIESFVNIAGTTLGVPKTLAALLSGEMRDTVELNPAGVYVLEKLFSRKERADLFRSWAGSAALWPKGGNVIWGTDEGAPDDPENATLTSGYVYNFRPNNKPSTKNLTMEGAYDYLLQRTPTQYGKMLQTNHSFGITTNEKELKANNADFRKWTNPLEVQLPNAKSMSIFCLYGVGKPTERGYWYKEDEDEITGSQHVYVDNEVSFEDERPKIKNGVTFSDGDGTVSVLSLGAMCVDGWQRKSYNPAGIRVVTHEIEHRPQGFDIRGGSTTADHIDILGSAELNEAIINIVSGREELVKEKIISEIKSYVKRIKWPS